MNTALIEAAFFQIALVVAPAFAIFTFSAIRWDLRSRGTWSPSIVRALTFIMWSVVVVDAISKIPIVRPPVLALLAVTMAAFWFHPQIVDRLAHAPDPRRRAANAVRHVLELASSPFKAVDVEEVRLELAALDEYVTPATFEFIQLTRALLLHWLDGGPSTAPNAMRWHARMTGITTEWWTPQSAAGEARDPRRIMGMVVFRLWLPLTLTAGAALGLSVWSAGRPGPLDVVAAIVLGWLVVRKGSLGIAAASAGFVAAVVASTSVRITTCPSCDWASTTATVAGLSVVGLLCAGSLVAWNRRRKPPPRLTVIAAPPGPDETHLPEP